MKGGCPAVETDSVRSVVLEFCVVYYSQRPSPRETEEADPALCRAHQDLLLSGFVLLMKVYYGQFAVFSVVFLQEESKVPLRRLSP